MSVISESTPLLHKHEDHSEQKVAVSSKKLTFVDCGRDVNRIIDAFLGADLITLSVAGKATWAVNDYKTAREKGWQRAWTDLTAKPHLVPFLPPNPHEIKDPKQIKGEMEKICRVLKERLALTPTALGQFKLGQFKKENLTPTNPANPELAAKRLEKLAFAVLSQKPARWEKNVLAAAEKMDEKVSMLQRLRASLPNAFLTKILAIFAIVVTVWLVIAIALPLPIGFIIFFSFVEACPFAYGAAHTKIRYDDLKKERLENNRDEYVAMTAKIDNARIWAAGQFLVNLDTLDKPILKGEERPQLCRLIITASSFPRSLDDLSEDFSTFFEIAEKRGRSLIDDEWKWRPALKEQVSSEIMEKTEIDKLHLEST